jgi:hypothetical protein
MDSPLYKILVSWIWGVAYSSYVRNFADIQPSDPINWAGTLGIMGLIWLVMSQNSAESQKRKGP